MNTNPLEPHSTVEDFNSLGIRINEARPRIIRQAAARKAELLHRQQLAGAGATADLGVTNLCVTLYKVLDPRRRMTTTERALLSQTEPIPQIEPRWLHPRSKQKVKRPTRQRTGFGAVAYESLSTGQAAFPDPDAPLPTQRQLFLERWVVYARQRVIWGALVLALLFGMLLARQLRFRPSADPSLDHAPSLALDKTTTPNADSVSKLTSPPATEPKPPPEPSPEPEPTPSLTPEPERTPVSEPEPSPARDVVEPDGGDMETAPIIDPATDPAAQPLPNIPEELSQMIARLQPFIEAFTSSPATPVQVPSTVDPPTPARPPAADTPPNTNAPGRAAMPTDAEIVSARERLLRLIADRPVAVTDTGRERAIDEILDMRLGAAAGSVDMLVISQVAAERLIGLGKFDRAATLIAGIEQDYEVQPPKITQAITERLASSAQNLADHRRLVSWALYCSERFLLNEQFEAASEITRAVLPSVGKVNAPSLRTQLSKRRDAIVIMKRMAESSQQILQTHSLDDASTSDATQVGRYRCLMLRDWQSGLAWLAQSSDPRLAQAAAREIMWLGSPEQSVTEAQQIADIWLETGDRLRGRMSDSARLHAYDLLTKASGDAAGLEALELKKRLEKMRQALSDLMPEEPSVPANNNQAPGAGPPAGMASNGMLGRMTVDGQDRGVLIQYEPGTAIDQNVITQIFQALRQPPVTFTLEFQGTLRLEKPTTIRVVASNPPALNGGQLIRVNGNAQALVAGVRGESVALDLPAGQHHLFWRISATTLNQAFLFVQDEQSSERLPILVPTIASPLPSPVKINLIRNR